MFIALQAGFLGTDPKAITVVGLLLVAIAMLALGKFVVPRWVHDDLRAERSEDKVIIKELRDALAGLVRAYERLSTEALAAERDATTEMKNASFQIAQLVNQVEGLKSEIMRSGEARGR